MPKARMSLEKFLVKVNDVFGDDPKVCRAATEEDFAALYRLIYPYSRWPHGNRWLGQRGAPTVTPRWLLDADASTWGRKRRDAILRKYDCAPWMTDWLQQECRDRRLKLKSPWMLRGDDGEACLPTAV